MLQNDDIFPRRDIFLRRDRKGVVASRNVRYIPQPLPSGRGSDLNRKAARMEPAT